MSDSEMSIAEDDAGRQIRVRGLVQGVGFRPSVWRHAQDCGLTGFVLNDGDGVLIKAWGRRGALETFVQRLSAEPPPLARVDEVVTEPLHEPAPPGHFRIVESTDSEVHTGVVPDAATCPHCLNEIDDKGDRRYRYPFTNCTHCGPRLTIVETLPYDRARTSMKVFDMCPDCVAEYENPTDRRFHAQPNACPVCGPHLWLEDRNGGHLTSLETEDVVTEAAHLLRKGEILAIKGLGGFHLACDATNNFAVQQLRTRKRRPDKPLALMARDREMIERYADVTDHEWAQLITHAAPIVVLDQRLDENRLSPLIAPGQEALGFMLPYTPLHHLLMQALEEPIVLTSGNRVNEPQCTGNEDARERLGHIADHFLTHDREIVNRVDDSVVRMAGPVRQMMRRARGFAPISLLVPQGFLNAPSILALGADLKNTFCLLSNGRAIVSQHIGDLEETLAQEDLGRNLSLYGHLFEHKPQIIACDRHPRYFSARLARTMAAGRNTSIAEVQHHHAHIVACLAEHGVAINAPMVLGITLDGIGYGADGTIWGGEFMLADYRSFRRLAHFRQIPLPGGDQAMREPWRNLYAHLAADYEIDRLGATFPNVKTLSKLQDRPLAVVEAMIRRRINSPKASSAGRLFDAAAALLDVHFEKISFEGQAAMELERLAASCRQKVKAYGWRRQGSEPLVLDWRPMWWDMLQDAEAQTPASVIAARFHQTVTEAVVDTAQMLAVRTSASAIVLSGGVFQNRLLLTGVMEALKAAGHNVLAPQSYPANDGGIALGQAFSAAAVALSSGFPKRIG